MITTIRPLLLTTVVALALTGCGASSGGTDQGSSDAVRAGTAASSVKDAIQKDYNDNGVQGYHHFPWKKLPADVQKKFKSIHDTDYPPAWGAQKLDDAQVFMVAHETDGGSYYWFFDEDGKDVTSVSQGESGDPNWS
jgi:hypothetical protein